MADTGKLYLFRSASSEGLRGFTVEAKGQDLPAKLGPWTGIGIVRGDQSPPHGLSRKAIEVGIAERGFQMFRNKKT